MKKINWTESNIKEIMSALREVHEYMGDLKLDCLYLCISVLEHEYQNIKNRQSGYAFDGLPFNEHIFKCLKKVVAEAASKKDFPEEVKNKLLLINLFN